MVLSRKGNIAMIDAMVFLILLSAVSVTMFAGADHTEIRDEPIAKDICDDLFSMRLSPSMLSDTDDEQIFPIGVLIASNMNSGHTEDMRTFIREVMDDLVPYAYGYELSIGYNGKKIEVGRQGQRESSSEYSCSQHIVGSMYMDVHIRLY